MPNLRLDKFLVSCDVCSRSEARKLVKAKRIKINDSPAKAPDQKIDTEKDRVFFDGKLLDYREFHYYMLNKPAGFITATEDTRQETVMDLLPDRRRKNLSPVGRLDKDTEGLLLITDDGQLNHRLLAPGFHVRKTYLAGLRKTVSEEDVQKFRDGLDIGEKALTAPALLQRVESGADCLDSLTPEYLKALPRAAAASPFPSEISWALVSITEGKFHQIKRMFEAVDNEVLYLKRMSMGSLLLDPELKPGQWRMLTPEEIRELKKTGGQGDGSSGKF
ncbi:MAG: pseudouridine synthase [Eubacterium sp.]|nr:pseudouridine synthase [Eubacterium sp.]